VHAADVHANAFDRISNFTGKLTSWLTLLMVLVTVVIVVMRYAFDAGLVWMQESVTWMHAAVFMLGAGYTLLHDDHVRVDIFYREMTPRRRGWVDLMGVLLFLLPLCAYLGWAAIDFAAVSWSLHETSREPGGLPYPLIPILKSIVILMPVLVGLQGVSLMLNSIRHIREG
jgi:TRAP-type mannitol/chloroaromatic compound transport system permease small subunit